MFRKRNIYNAKEDKLFTISRSKIDDFLNCKRCFYLDRRLGLKKPDQIPFNLNNAVDNLFKNEPETIEWIEKFSPETVFWDIGANVGIYSIYAGLNPKLKIFSFEPAANNFHLLNHNIIINNKSGPLAPGI